MAIFGIYVKYEKPQVIIPAYKNICEIGKERILRAGEEVIRDKALINNAKRSGAFQKGEAYAEFTDSPIAIATQNEVRKILDVGFRIFKLDDTNMKDVYYGAAEYTQTLLDDMTSNIKEDRTGMDLLYGCLLEWGLPFSLLQKTQPADFLFNFRVLGISDIFSLIYPMGV